MSVITYQALSYRYIPTIRNRMFSNFTLRSVGLWCSLRPNDYKGRTSDGLRQHILTHSIEKQYKCDLCSYSSRRNISLTVHKLKHTGEKPFACTHCEFRTTSAQGLKSHNTLIHTAQREDKPNEIECEYCDYTGKSMEDLLKHVQIIHVRSNS